VDHPSQVVSVRPDGSGETQLTHVPDGKQAGAPDLSPDGTTIAYVSNEDGDDFGVWAMNTDGTGQHKLFGTAGFDYLQPRWSPGGGRFVVTRCDNQFGFPAGCDLLISSPDGAHVRTLVAGGRFSGNASFSPNGRRVAFDSDRGGYVSSVWVVRSSGGRPVRLTKPNFEAFWPSWSPDGRHLLLSNNCCRPRSDVFRMRPDGSQLRRLTNVPGGGGAAFASYSPDGGRIVFSSDQRRGPKFAKSDLFVMRSDGSHVRRIVSDVPNAVAPDWGREGS
jgi:TolB protein